MQIINDGEEPENFFWVGLGGKKKFDRVSRYLIWKENYY